MPKRHRNPSNPLMFNEPPYAERHVRWCERTVREIIPYFLLDYSRFHRAWFMVHSHLTDCIMSWIYNQLLTATATQYRYSLY